VHDFDGIVSGMQRADGLDKNSCLINASPSISQPSSCRICQIDCYRVGTPHGRVKKILLDEQVKVVVRIFTSVAHFRE